MESADHLAILLVVQLPLVRRRPSARRRISISTTGSGGAHGIAVVRVLVEGRCQGRALEKSNTWLWEALPHPREPEATRRDESWREELGLQVTVQSGRLGGQQRFDYLTPSPKPGGTVPMRHATALTLQLILDPQASPPQTNPVRSIHRFTS